MDRDIQDTVFQLLHESCVAAGEFKGVIESSVTLNCLGLDSLKLVELVYVLEQRFCVQLPEQSLYELQSIGDLVNAVELACGVQAS